MILEIVMILGDSADLEIVIILESNDFRKSNDFGR